MLDILQALQSEFEDHGLRCEYNKSLTALGVSVLAVEGNTKTVALRIVDGNLSAIEYNMGDDTFSDNTTRNDLGEVPLCDHNAFSDFVDMIADRTKRS
jgi:hypothetical protein